MFRSVIYTSAASPGFTTGDLRDVLNASRINNAFWHVSGVLLFEGGNFLQVLEGPPLAVERTIARIEKDGRHRNVSVLSDTETEGRTFGDWAMGYQVPDGHALDGEGSFTLTPEAVTARLGDAATSEVKVFVNTFFRVNRRYAA